jgi:phospho-N-acetylmuramoyl-pentapeptide-transferase
MLENLSTDVTSPLLYAPLQYFLFKACLVGFLSFILCFFGIKYFLILVKKKQICTQPIRSDGPESHIKAKKNTPTMGGLLIIGATFISSLILLELNNYILITLFVMISFSAIGFIDDYMKVTGRGTKGLRGGIKLVIQFLIVGLVIIGLQITDSTYLDSKIAIPFSNYSIDIGIFYIFFATLVIVGSSNATNLTDGLDGLVSVPAIINLACLSLIIYFVSNAKIAETLKITHIRNIDELIMFCASLIGAISAFLIFNIKPAKLFMGDVGSLGIGSSIGVIAVILKQELVFGIISLLFVAEALSVIIQVTSYKLTKKRIFKMAPLHHHFEKMGWNERKVVERFWFASAIFAIIGLLGLVI